jgi:hypothetical protein
MISGGIGIGYLNLDFFVAQQCLIYQRQRHLTYEENDASRVSGPNVGNVKSLYLLYTNIIVFGSQVTSINQINQVFVCLPTGQ